MEAAGRAPVRGSFGVSGAESTALIGISWFWKDRRQAPQTDISPQSCIEGAELVALHYTGLGFRVSFGLEFVGLHGTQGFGVLLCSAVEFVGGYMNESLSYRACPAQRVAPAFPR